MQSYQSCSSFYTKLRRAYSPATSRQRSELTGAPSPLRGVCANTTELSRPAPAPTATTTATKSAGSTPVTALSAFGPSATEGGHDAVKAVAELQRKLAAIQEGNFAVQRGFQQQKQRQQSREHQQQEDEHQQQQGSFYCSQHVPQGRDGAPGGEGVGLSGVVERKMGSFSSVVSPLSSRSSKEKDYHNNQAARDTFLVTTGNKKGDDNEELTPDEMAFLRVVEFAVPVAVYAQLESGADLVDLCDRATVKLFPRHLLFIRPDGVAVVELVIEELCELNEDDTASSLDCIVQSKNMRGRQLIRAICSDPIARGALFKLISARRTHLENLKRLRE